MTYDETVDRVLAHLRETRGDWEVVRISKQACLRRISNYMCPLESMAGRGGFLRAIKDLGLDPEAGHHVVGAADDHHMSPPAEGRDVYALRLLMLKAAFPDEAAGLEVDHD